MFRTEVQVQPAAFTLGLHEEVVTIGSCFAEVIGNKLRQSKVPTLVNPFGTIFNPVSVSRLLQATSGQAYDFARHLVQHNGMWHAYDLHSSLSAPDKAEMLHLIDDRLTQTRQHLQQARLLIITLGTAVAYRLKSTQQLVANCHKLPAQNFDKTLLSLTEMQEALLLVQSQLQQLNPNLQILLTVSPVRHVKETLEINSVSKALLRVLCHQLQESQNNIHYFPAYELMLDDLRDYRFYKRDMLHPTEQAEDYIWEKFVWAYYNTGFQQFLPFWGNMQRALQHRSFHPQSEAHQKFLRQTLQQLRQLASKYNIDVQAEEAILQQQLIK